MIRPPLTGRTKVLGVIGDPVAHSLSPQLHNFVLDKLGLDYTYVAFRVKPDLAQDVGRAFRSLGLAGLNVTIPHKEAVYDQMDELTEEARVVGAVNTVGLDGNGRLVGHNTDVEGFLGSLRVRGLLEEISGRAALVRGAGGAALGQAGCGPIYLVNRTLSRAEELAGWFSYVCPDVKVHTFSTGAEEELSSALAESRIVINVTPLGMYPKAEALPLPEGALPPAGSIVYDTIYNPATTRWLQEAEKAGCVGIGGLDMLIIQGMESLAWWLGRKIDWEALLVEIRTVLLAALETGKAGGSG